MHLSPNLMRMLLLRGAAQFHDTVMGALAFFLALLTRLDWPVFSQNLGSYFLASLFFGVIVGIVGFAVGLNRGIWRYASLADLSAILKTATIAVGIFTVAHFLLVRLEDIPRSTIVIAWAFTILLIAGPRVVYRIYRNSRDRLRTVRTHAPAPKRVLIVGATDNADTFLKVLEERSSPHFTVVGIIDERGRRVGRFIRRVPIMGTVDDLPSVLAKLAREGKRPSAVILARSREDYQSRASLEALVETAIAHRLELLRLGDTLDTHEVNAEIEVRPIEIEDLLQRAPVKLDGARIASLVKERRVLITGAGGSIGSEITRQVAALGPSALMLLDSNEFALYTIESELSGWRTHVPKRAMLCDVRNKDAVARIFEEFRPNIVFHAAALKHVPIVELQPLEGLHTNAIGTRNVAEAAVQTDTEAMILLSTDKAVKPVNVMGASKRLAEMLCQSMDMESNDTGTRFLTVRFGNVLGSGGSVVPHFRKQIQAGGPVTVTHPEIERFFMTIPEAVSLVMQAAAYGLTDRREKGRIFVLEMGTAVKIVDLARNMIRLSGLRPDVDIKIVFTGLRPGEKLYEELFDANELLAETHVPGVVAAFPRTIERNLVNRILGEMERLIAAGATSDCVRLLENAVPEYRPGEEARRLLAINAQLNRMIEAPAMQIEGAKPEISA